MWEDDRYPTGGESFPGNTRREKIKLFLSSLLDDWWIYLLIIAGLFFLTWLGGMIFGFDRYDEWSYIQSLKYSLIALL